MWNYTPSSKLCHLKTQIEVLQIINKAYDRHLNNIKAAKSIIKITSPYKPYFMSQCSKYQNRYEMHKIDEANKSNTLLLKKMLKIDRRNSLQKNCLSDCQKLYSSPSNQQSRKCRALSIDQENIVKKIVIQKLASRITSAKSCYQRDQQLYNSQKQIKYKRNISQNGRRFQHFDFQSMVLSASFDCKSKKTQKNTTLNTKETQDDDFTRLF